MSWLRALVCGRHVAAEAVDSARGRGTVVVEIDEMLRHGRAVQEGWR